MTVSGCDIDDIEDHTVVQQTLQTNLDAVNNCLLTLL